MNEFSLRQVNIMQSLCDELINLRIDPIKFVSNQWDLIDLVRSDSPIFWNEYQNIVNEIEIILSIALDTSGQITEEDWLKIKKIGLNLQIELKKLTVE